MRFSSEQHSNRIELRAESNFRGGEVVDYRVWVPTDSVVSERCSEGKVHIQGLSGDVIVEGTRAAVDFENIIDAMYTSKR